MFYIKSKAKAIILEITSIKQKIHKQKPSNKIKISFKAGLTPKMLEEIKKVNVVKISEKFTKQDIPTDFQGNQVIAWCSDKTFDIFQALKKQFGLKLAFPKGLYVRDFTKLNIEEQTLYGFCNLMPTKLIKDSNKVTPSRVIFFNNFDTIKNQLSHDIQWLYDWKNINEIADFRYTTNQSATDFFLDLFLHESLHSAHENRLLQKCGKIDLTEKLKTIDNSIEIQKYQEKYGNKISQICDYALANPFEAIACDTSKLISDSLDPETLLPIKNPFSGTPYENLSFWQRINIPNYSDESRPLSEILRHFWNGKFN